MNISKVRLADIGKLLGQMLYQHYTYMHSA